MDACCMLHGVEVGSFFFGFLSSTDSWVIGSLELCMMLFNRGLCEMVCTALVVSTAFYEKTK